MNPKNDKAPTARDRQGLKRSTPTKESDMGKGNTNIRVDIDALIRRANTAQPFGPLFAETPEDCEVLVIFRKMEPSQRHAALKRVGGFLAQDLNGGAA